MAILDVTDQFWAFVDDAVAQRCRVTRARTEMARADGGDEREGEEGEEDVRELGSFLALCGCVAQIRREDGAAADDSGLMVVADHRLPPAPSVHHPLPRGARWEPRSGAYVFDDIDVLFYGTRDILTQFGSTAAHAVRLRCVDVVIGLILAYIDVSSLSEDVETGMRLWRP